MNRCGLSVRLGVGSPVLFDGDVVVVVELAGARVTIRNERTGQFVVVGLGQLVAGCRPVEARPAGPLPVLGSVLAALTPPQQPEVSERAGHVREVLTGYRAGHAEAAEPGEPRAAFAATVPLRERYAAKAGELGVTVRTVQRWAADYRRDGEAGLVDARAVRGIGSRVDPRWEAALRQVLSEKVYDSTPTRGAVLARTNEVVEDAHGAGVVPVPSPATAYRRLAEIAKGTNAVQGSAKGRRSIAERPQGLYGRLHATRPGEYVVLDTQDLDVFAMEEVTCRWVGVQLTAAQDLATRCIVGLRCTPVSTKSIDVAGVLYQAVVPHEAPAHWPAQACWPYLGLPEQVGFSEMPRSRAPVCAPETLVIDHGRVFLSAHVMSVCARLGISVQPAQPYKPTDKPTIERFFKTLREGLIQHLPAYKGPDVYSRGHRVEDGAFLFVHELEDLIREWIATVYHRSKHDGLTVPEFPHLPISPIEAFEIGVARAGTVRIPATPELVYDFLPVAARTIQHYGVEINGLRYNGPALDRYRNQPSPHGGTFGGKWPLRFNPDDVRTVYFHDPADDSWHRLAWEHESRLDGPFSAEAAAYARRLAAGRTDVDPTAALRDLLARWQDGVVAEGRAERRMAVRLAAEYAAVPIPAADPDLSDTSQRPELTVVADATGDADDGDAKAATEVAGDDDPFDIEARLDDYGVFGGSEPGGGFYADAFEVIS
jgi:transposase InsO family protein